MTIKNSAGNDAAPESAHPTLDAWAWIARAREAASRLTDPAATKAGRRKSRTRKPRSRQAAGTPDSPEE
jgi:hypothetical protein